MAPPCDHSKPLVLHSFPADHSSACCKIQHSVRTLPALRRPPCGARPARVRLRRGENAGLGVWEQLGEPGKPWGPHPLEGGRQPEVDEGPEFSENQNLDL